MAKPNALSLVLPSGTALTVHIHYSSRKTLGIQVSSQGVVVRSPSRVTLRAIVAALEEKAAWIQKHSHVLSFAPPPLEPHTLCWYQGVEYPLEQLLPQLPQEGLSQALQHWYRQRATEVFGALLEGYGYSGKWLVANQRKRWGSCNSQGHIRLNWRAVMLPPALTEYLIVHELAHLKQLNHSPLFWQEVQRMLPDYRTRHQAFHGWDMWLSWRL